jgi:hypothetical protein
MSAAYEHLRMFIVIGTAFKVGLARGVVVCIVSGVRHSSEVPTCS